MCLLSWPRSLFVQLASVPKRKLFRSTLAGRSRSIRGHQADDGRPWRPRISDMSRAASLRLVFQSGYFSSMRVVPRRISPRSFCSVLRKPDGMSVLSRFPNPPNRPSHRIAFSPSGSVRYTPEPLSQCRSSAVKVIRHACTGQVVCVRLNLSG